MPPRWEVRKVSGKGVLSDTLVAVFKELSERKVHDLKLAYDILYIGKVMDFIDPTELYATKTPATVTDADLAALPTVWQGKQLPNGMNYCVILDFEGDEAENVSVTTVRKAIELAKDKVVISEGDNRFSSGGASEARKNFAQTSRTEGGVWGVKRKTPPRP